MAGRILISDAVVTNRIVLRCKLAAAFYEVAQAGTLAAVARLAEEIRPDAMILDADRGWKQALQAAGGHAGPPCPVILLMASATPADRAQAIRAGAAAVLTRPLNDDMLLATLRRTMRESGTDAELLDNAGLSLPLGFAEPAPEFRGMEPVSLVVLGSARLNTLVRPLERAFGGRVRCPAFGDTLAQGSTELAGKAFIIAAEADCCSKALRLISELRSRAATRDAAILLVLLSSAQEQDALAGKANEMAATALDIGADDVQFGEDAEEMAARIEAQMRRRRRQDALRSSISAGLRLAARDPLTGLYNRRVAMPQLSDLLAKACETGRAITVMVADLDRFKQINDTYGHASGDRVLVEVARRLRNSVSGSDLVARIGGEEFMIALPGATLEAGSLAAARIRGAVRDLPVRDPAVVGGIPVTASIGIATYVSGPRRATPSAEDLLALADQALLRAKSDGRDKITVARSAA